MPAVRKRLPDRALRDGTGCQRCRRPCRPLDPLPRIDLLVNCAGVSRDRSEWNQETSAEVMSINFFPVTEAARLARPKMGSVEGDASTLASLILTRRLQKCRTDLARPGNFPKSVSDIAFNWGFRNLSHFSKRVGTSSGYLLRVLPRWLGVRIREFRALCVTPRARGTAGMLDEKP
ncbi:Helix-turn-helix domain-containing protein [Rhizobium sp. 9140]|nr:Helix-turn-helix domain-containing protein [Rhizobium sp. 9140]